MASLLSPLDALLKRSGAHMAEREGWLVAADFGSHAAEIAVSRARAGLADVSSIAKFEVRGEPAAIAGALPPGTEPGRVLQAAGVWWCVVSDELLLVLGPSTAAARLRAELEAAVQPETRIEDVTAERVAVCLIGPCAREVLVRAGATTAATGSVRVASVGGVPTLILREGEQQWLLVAAAAEARNLWHALSEAGAPLGLAYVGADALQHLHAAGAA